MLGAERSITVVLVGDTKIGKSALINRITKNAFSQEYTPTSFDKVAVKRNVEGKWLEFALWDTSGCSAYDNVRSLPYEEAHVFLLCFKISDPASLSSVRHKWMKELRRHRPEVPIILCGCQADLRHDPPTIASLSKMGRSPVAPEQALAVCCEIDAVSYVETSSKEGDSFYEVFEVCAHAAPPLSTTENTHRNNSSLKNKRNGPNNVSFFPDPNVKSDAFELHKVSPRFKMTMKKNSVIEEYFFPPPGPSASSSLVSPCCSEPPFMIPAPKPSNGLSRRTSFRSQRIIVPPPPPPKSSPPLLNTSSNHEYEVDSFDPKSLPSSKIIPVKKTYESIKSHTSTGSTVSKTSSCSTSSLINHPSSNTQRPTPPSTLTNSDIVVNSGNHEVLNKFNFISPKTGVFRPINAQTLPPNIKPLKKKQHCSLM
ncbi:Ras-like GTP-binding protein RHO,Rho-related GTP-binding protein RhoQ,Ras-related protein Rac2,Rho-related protein rac1A,Rho-related GTP-binding protein RhoU,Ras-related protein rac-2,GTP-binding protein Rho1,GTP-binding protein RHO1,Rho-related GTP-binding protein RhoG,GTP-binding protein rho5,GTP-binding protein rhoA,Ras-related C3 botulinum toxin substrate 2,Transforming protein RhoA,Ras-related C3 botulinum toxin substrate 3,Rho-related GTP-binding protein RhoA-C,Rho-related protein rac1C,Ras-related p|uniref:Uncharacterized protein n=1 Tax=Lepeophtheirus salmonis TaxID=72036 RepID=A0A7R8CU86_LEPSM|nr:Ras-like GTP-binding protein RHO,Rho-related GTP-binding protein RhoQ,Ras-related protein Rac2,Rho-related protein rac1A,Rho-related GTP-binding protein RhoU,Ras-related protein rac-2,GTP-binding protein Rho1,GTP-binding protein RHO1,Rho-related GTP-binding protein RhoG,GTP-binding protein rho5,GTP-binding protein rhoA,Ras-related C3 botulinum toxin substrate 2,Transforming protein RhoA,Ras-related C3 botulinum toxin substrate 3,Rho-related GTP-binding protein RhoA-C,Rho-related protein rac1C,Ra